MSTSSAALLLDFPLGERQQAILDFVRAYVQEHGHAPALREIASGVGMRSTSNVAYHINRLVNQGYLHKQEGKTRTLVLLNAEPQQMIEPNFRDLQTELVMLRTENQRLREWCRQLERERKWEREVRGEGRYG
jgi:SOS-response transcriptional repressor LexA